MRLVVCGRRISPDYLGAPEIRSSASATHVSSGFEALPEVGEVGFETALGYVFASAFLLVFVLRRPEEDE